MKPSVIPSILERTAEAAAARLRALPRQCRIAEIRADHLNSGDLPGLVSVAGRPLIVTTKKPGEKIRTLTSAIEAGAAYVDVEHGGDEVSLLERYPSRVLLSLHGISCRWEELQAAYRGMAATGAALLKIVPLARDLRELAAVAELLRLARFENRPLACFAEGRAGRVSRLLAPSWGSWGTYGACSPDAATGTGQFTVHDMLHVYNVLEITGETVRYGLAGGDLERSPSPSMHKAAFEEEGLDAVYLPLEAGSFEQLRNDLAPAGFGVTIPFKEDAFRSCFRTDEWGAAAGAVNTVRIEEAGWFGHNTDASGADRLLSATMSLAGKRALVVGAGGTGRTVSAVLARAGAAVTMVNRDLERAAVAAVEFGADTLTWSELKSARAEILVNATPLGKKGESLIDPPPDCALVMDFAYGPRPTPLVESAAERGIEVIDGVELLVAQAVDQHRILTGITPSAATMRNAALQQLDRTTVA